MGGYCKVEGLYRNVKIPIALYCFKIWECRILFDWYPRLVPVTYWPDILHHSCFRNLRAREVFRYRLGDVHLVPLWLVPKQHPQQIVCEMPAGNHHVTDCRNVSPGMQAWVHYRGVLVGCDLIWDRTSRRNTRRYAQLNLRCAVGATPTRSYAKYHQSLSGSHASPQSRIDS